MTEGDTHGIWHIMENSLMYGRSSLGRSVTNIPDRLPL
jgi:hypothetical protein